MAVTDGSMPKGFQRLPRREKDWLRHYLPNLIPGFTPHPIPPGTLSSVLNQALERDSNLVSRIEEARQNMLVKDQHLAWIDSKDQRLLIWLLAEMNQADHMGGREGVPPIYAPFLHGIPAEDRYEKIILTIDLWGAPLEHKKEILSYWKETRANEMSTSSEVGWLDQDDGEQLKWAWEYLQKQQTALLMPTPATNAELYGAVAASLDRLAKTHKAVREQLLDKMKRTWAQRKYRASEKAKKQHYLPLTKQTHSRLEWLSENWACRKSEVLEKLINQSYENANGDLS